MLTRLGICGLLLTLSPVIAHAGLYDYQYTGEVTSVTDPEGLFGAVLIGTIVTGELHIVGPIPPGVNVQNFLETYRFPLAAGSTFTTIVGGREFAASQSLGINVLNPARFADAGILINGTDDISKLDASGIPDDEYLVSLGTHLSFRFPSGGPSTYPNLPTSLFPLSQYGPFPDLSGSITSFTNDSDDDVASTSTITFAITSLQPVPEPASVVSSVLGLITLTGYGWQQRRKAKIGNQHHE